MVHVQLISFPKCGRTWIVDILSLHFLVHYQNRTVDSVTGKDLRYSIQSLKKTCQSQITFHHDGLPHHARSVEALISKGKVSLDKSGYFGTIGKVLLLTRDPRDAMISLYFEQTHRGDLKYESIDKFVRERLPVYIEYYNRWVEWVEKMPERLLVARYEELRLTPFESFSRIFKFVGIDIEDSKLTYLIEQTSFESMNAREAKGQFDTGGGHGPHSPKNKNDKESFKVRRGKVCGYGDYMDPETIEYCNKEIINFKLFDYITVK